GAPKKKKAGHPRRNSPGRIWREENRGTFPNPTKNDKPEKTAAAPPPKPPAADSTSSAVVPATAIMAPPGHRLVDPLDLYFEREPGGGFLLNGEFLNLNGQTGAWTIGREKRAVSATALVFVHVEGMAIRHRKLGEGKRVERGIGLGAEGCERRARAELDDREEHEWPRNKRGEPEDPWKPTTLLPMRSLEDDEPVVFGPIAPTQLTAIKQFVGV